MSKAELWLGVKYSEMNKQQRKIYWRMSKKESRARNIESIKESNKNYREKHKQYVSNLEYELDITKKALELACERVKYFEEMQDKEMGFSEFFGYESDYDLQAIIEQYKQQAEKELQNG